MKTDLTVFTEVLNRIHKHMTYQSDELTFKKVEYWRDWKAEILAGQMGIKDDCDGFALTIAELLALDGIPTENIGLVFCEIKGLGYHLAIKAKSRETQDWYIMDCNTLVPTKRDSNEWPVSEYRWESVMYYNKIGHWESEVDANKQ